VINSEIFEMTKDAITPLVDLMKTLAHPVRLRVLALLREGELCVCQVTEVLGIPMSTASEHLTELRKAGLLGERKEGRWVYYGLAPRPGLEGLLAALWPHVDALGQVEQDREAARATRKVPVEQTCSKAKPCASRRGKEVSRVE
jgi:DNA-binding transcriptional ArsR family regulator